MEGWGKPILQSCNLPIFQRSIKRVSITRLKLPKDTSRSFHVVAINDKNLDYEIETGRVIIEFADSDWCDQ